MRDSKRAVQSTMYKRRERDTGRAIYSCTAVQYPSSAHYGRVRGSARQRGFARQRGSWLTGFWRAGQRTTRVCPSTGAWAS